MAHVTHAQLIARLARVKAAHADLKASAHRAAGWQAPATTLNAPPATTPAQPKGQ